MAFETSVDGFSGKLIDLTMFALQLSSPGIGHGFQTNAIGYAIRIRRSNVQERYRPLLLRDTDSATRIISEACAEKPIAASR